MVKIELQYCYAIELWKKSDISLRKMIALHIDNVSDFYNDDFVLPPFIWDEERRFQLRCDLDALFGHLYNLTRDEFAYILETFPIVRRKDEAQYGEYRTKRVILEKFDALADDPMLVGACTPLAERVSVLSSSAQPILPDSEPELDEAEEYAAQPEPELVDVEEPAEQLEAVPAQPEDAAEPEPPAAPAAVPCARDLRLSG